MSKETKKEEARWERAEDAREEAREEAREAKAEAKAEKAEEVKEAKEAKAEAKAEAKHPKAPENLGSAIAEMHDQARQVWEELGRLVSTGDSISRLQNADGREFGRRFTLVAVNEVAAAAEKIGKALEGVLRDAMELRATLRTLLATNREIKPEEEVRLTPAMQAAKEARLEAEEATVKAEEVRLKAEKQR